MISGISERRVTVQESTCLALVTVLGTSGNLSLLLFIAFTFSSHQHNYEWNLPSVSGRKIILVAFYVACMSPVVWSTELNLLTLASDSLTNSNLNSELPE
jgi:hypothetical protein